jgi:hypothetical protein
MGPIKVLDVLYGHQKKIRDSGVEYFAHKIGFTVKSLTALLTENGFPVVGISLGRLDIGAMAFRQSPSAELMAELGVRIDV